MSKLHYTCVTCLQEFNTKYHLKRHYMRKKGCKSPDDVLTEILLKTIQQLERNIEEYKFFKYEGTALNMLKNRYDRLFRIKDSINSLEIFLKTHLKNAYEDEKKKQAVLKVFDEIYDEYIVLKNEYKRDSHILFSKSLDI